jgi:hypothetical protein
MRHLLSRRPSAALIVAIIALVVAASGTAVAATKLVAGDSMIQKNSLSGNRLRNHSVYWNKIKWSSVGTVPNAQNATNAATLGGQAPSAFDAASNFTRTAYVNTSEGNSTTLAAFGPFALVLHCGTNNGAPDSYVSAVSTQAFSTVGSQKLSAGESAPGSISEASPGNSGDPATAFEDSYPNNVDFTTPGGGLWIAQIVTQTNNPGNSGQCGAFATIQKVH